MNDKERKESGLVRESFIKANYRKSGLTGVRASLETPYVNSIYPILKCLKGVDDTNAARCAINFAREPSLFSGYKRRRRTKDESPGGCKD